MPQPRSAGASPSLGPHKPSPSNGPVRGGTNPDAAAHDVKGRASSDGHGRIYVERKTGEEVEIRDVWKDNLHEEFKRIRAIVVDHPYVAMDTEFPGVVARPIGSLCASADYPYQSLRCNVDLLKLIQLGVAFTDSEGKPAKGCPCWQFHFKFSLDDDMYAQDSIDLLVRSGINFEKHDEEGIDVQDFGELMMSSGLVLDDSIHWISFHSGYDFGYLLKLMTCQPLPSDEEAFFELLRAYFPRIYDVKHIMHSTDPTFRRGLNYLAEELHVERIGPMHQAGSDSLLTAATFFQMRVQFFNGKLTSKGIVGVIHGLGKDGDPHREERERRVKNGESGGFEYH